jgi:hypothetical protein
MTARDFIVEFNDCPACKAPAGTPCNTVVDGEQTHWTHDARVYADVVNDSYRKELK